MHGWDAHCLFGKHNAPHGIRSCHPIIGHDDPGSPAVLETHILPRTMGSFLGMSTSITPVSSRYGYCWAIDAEEQGQACMGTS